MDIEKVARYKTAIYNNEDFEKIAIWSALARGLVAVGPKIRNLGTAVKGGTINTYNSAIKGGLATKAAKGAVLGGASGAMTHNSDKNDGSFGNSVFGSVAKGAFGGAAVGTAAGAATKAFKLKPISKPSMPVTPSTPTATTGMGSTASELVDLLFEKLAQTVPGTPQWIAKSKCKGRSKDKGKMKKKASDSDPYKATKTVAIASAAGVPGDMLFDLASDSLHVFKQNRNKFKGVRGVASMFKSPEWRGAFREFAQKQKGFALPASAAIAAIPVAIAYKSDRNNIAKSAADESPRESYVETFGESILTDKRLDSKYDQRELEMGVKVEHEHTKKVLPYNHASFIARKIAKDHLDEFPDYYTRLAKLEAEAKKARKVKK